jgi:hypothetical protein
LLRTQAQVGNGPGAGFGQWLPDGRHALGWVFYYLEDECQPDNVAVKQPACRPEHSVPAGAGNSLILEQLQVFSPAAVQPDVLRS